MSVVESLAERTKRWEAEYLWELATRSYPAHRRRPEPDSDMRTPFQRDRDRIVHSKAFRRLKHKTQVFIAPQGDHYRTRLTHTLETCGIARTVARALGLNEDLTEAIGLGHDLGHPPFGHIGEEALDQILQERGRRYRHNEQSLRIVDELERGDEIALEMPYATFRYEVVKTDVVSPTDIEVVRNTGSERVVLTACHPLYSAAERIVVTGRLSSISLYGLDELTWYARGRDRAEAVGPGRA